MGSKDICGFTKKDISLMLKNSELSDYEKGMKQGALEVLKFIELKQPKDLKVACICGDVKYMVDKKELEQFCKRGKKEGVEK